MGLFNFVKEAGEKLWDSVSSHNDAATKVQEHLKKIGIPNSDKVNVVVEGNNATVTGEGLTQEDKEKILVAVGNVAGINNVKDNITTTSATANETVVAESQLYQVKSGDTLSAIAKHFYGDANQYNKIFEANKPMLSHPDKIYPGQTLRIPA